VEADDDPGTIFSVRRIFAAGVMAVFAGAVPAEEPLPRGALHRLELEKGVGDVRFAPDGLKLAVSGFDGSVTIFDVGKGEAERSLEGTEGRVTCVAWSPDGGMLAAGCEDNGRVHLWDARTGEAKGSLEWAHHMGSHGRGATAIGFFPDGKSFYTAGYEGKVRLWTTGLEEIRRLEGHSDCVVAALSRDGRRMFTASQDGTARLWDAATGAVLKELSIRPEIEAEAAHLGYPVFSPDGTRAWCGGGDGKLRVWSVPDGEAGAAWEAHGGFVGALDVMPDGSLVVSGGMHPMGAYGEPDGTWDNRIRFWDAETCEKILEIGGHRMTVNRCVFSGDGARLATSSWDGTVLLWDMTALGLTAKAAQEETDDALWERLGSNLPAGGWAAIRALGADPARAFRLIGGRLEPAKVDPDFSTRLASLIRELDDDAWKVRERAQAELTRLGPRAWGALRRVLEGKPSPEVEVRAKEILASETPWSPGTEDERRFVRAVQVVESAGGAGAAKILEKLSSGDPDSALTSLARAALKRLKGR
jgi:hypothetical protein